ncbi:MAG: hypothetical protein KAW12_19960 [Candidatus Aminicenantes bacterium]|nr:hypothetical protein [Candidatus Aminicenantes bacterium]
MSYCLDRKELEELIAAKIDGKPALEQENRTLALRVENAGNWDDQLIALTYFLSKIFEKKSKSGTSYEKLLKDLEKIWLLENDMLLEFEVFAEGFIKNLLHGEREPGTTLEDELIRCRDKQGRYRQ